MIIPKFTGYIENGKLKLDNKGKWWDYLQTIQGKVSLTLRKLTKKNERSINQNNYYFGVPVKLISNYTGHTTEEIHEILKYKFLKEYSEIKNAEGKIENCVRIKSSTELDTVSWEEYMIKIRQWASVKLSIYIPAPNECEW